VKPFLEALSAAPLLFDGAMGSLLYERGVFFTRSFDELNLSQPELIEKVHREYADAGADVLETNTFGATRSQLARHGHADKVEAINRAAVAIARRAAERRELHVAGAVGPTGVDWEHAAEPEGYKLAGVALDDVAAVRKMTKLWGDEAGRATKTDRILVLGATESGRRRALSGATLDIDWDWPPKALRAL